MQTSPGKVQLPADMKEELSQARTSTWKVNSDAISARLEELALAVSSMKEAAKSVGISLHHEPENSDS